MLRLRTAPRWPGLVAQVSAWTRDRLTDPFATARIVVSGQGAGRLLRQDLARLDGISAGLDLVSPDALARLLARRGGIDQRWRAWHGQGLVMAVGERLDEVARAHPLLGAHLGQAHPARAYLLADRAAALLRHYADVAPALTARWLAGDDAGLTGEPLPERTSWQPLLLRLACERLGDDPLTLQEELLDAASADVTPTGVFAVDDVTAFQRRLLCALAEPAGLELWQISGSGGERWSRAVADETVPSPEPPRPLPHVEVHHSHGRLRQAEVLRERLTACFEDDSSLEPRDVVIVCPRPEEYAGALDTVFGACEEPLAHPGRLLRVQPQSSRARSNPALELLEDLIRLPITRASAPELTALLLRRPIAHRWRLAEQGDDVVALVAGAGIRWGLDSAHRAHFGLADVAQGTWLSGLDSLLMGLSLARGSAPVLPAPAAEGLSSSDLELVGALCEVVSRLRKFVAETRTPATLAEWARRLRSALTELAGLPPAEEPMIAQAHAVLADLEESSSSARMLSRAEFSRVLSGCLPRPGRRTSAGNGAIQVVEPGELLHAEFRVVALLGVDDRLPGAGLADAIDLGDLAPDPRTRQGEFLLAHARAADRVLIVDRGRSERTNAPVAPPVMVSWLLRHLGAPATEATHPAHAVSETANGFDRLAFLAASERWERDNQVSRRGGAGLSPRAHRRQVAAGLPVADVAAGEAPRVTVAELAAFLDNPAKAFLRSAAGLTFFSRPELRDELALSLGGLESWQMQYSLLRAAQEGTSPEAAWQQARRQVGVPPGALGGVAVDDALATVRNLWAQARPAWQQSPEEQHVELDLGGVILSDTVTTRGSHIVEVTVSAGAKTILSPWLAQLALAASGMPCEAVVHRMAKEWGRSVPEVRRLEPPSPEGALARLRIVAEAYRIGTQRLLAVPFEPALGFLAELSARQGFRLADWQVPVGEFRARWRFRHESWEMFFGDRPSELFDDAAGPDDPGPSSPASPHDLPGPVRASRFAAWALALYHDLTGATG